MVIRFSCLTIIWLGYLFISNTVQKFTLQDLVYQYSGHPWLWDYNLIPRFSCLLFKNKKHYH